MTLGWRWEALEVVLTDRPVLGMSAEFIHGMSYGIQTSAARIRALLPAQPERTGERCPSCGRGAGCDVCKAKPGEPCGTHPAPPRPAADLVEAVGLLEFVRPRLANGTVQRIQVETFLARLKAERQG